MNRIVINVGDADKSRMLFERTCEVIKKLNARVEISYVKDSATIIKNLDGCSHYYDIFILDSANEECLKLSQRIRNNNLTASLIYVIHDNIQQLLKIIKYRPSQILSEKAEEKELAAALKYCLNEQNRSKPYFTVKTRNLLMRIHYDNILFFESNQRKVAVHTTKQIIEFYGKLDEVEALIPNDSFVRIHQSYIINMARISSLDKINRIFKLSDGSLVEISKSQYGNAITKYEEFAERY